MRRSVSHPPPRSLVKIAADGGREPSLCAQSEDLLPKQSFGSARTAPTGRALLAHPSVRARPISDVGHGSKAPLTWPSHVSQRTSGKSPFPLSQARNQGRRPPRIAGPSPGTAIWLLSCATDGLDVLGCHKVPVTEVRSPYHGPSMRGLGFRCERQQSPAHLASIHTTPEVRSGSEMPGSAVRHDRHGPAT
jgi:hypothetical protein